MPAGKAAEDIVVQDGAAAGSVANGYFYFKLSF
jgi:hypothetical protein